MTTSHLSFSLAVCFSLVACDAQDKAPPARASASAVATASAPNGAAATVSAAPPKPEAPKDPLAGTWQGNYDAKKGSVTLPPKVKDKTLSSEDGKASSGPGTVELVIGEGGEVKGKIAGALGACYIVGKAEEGVLRATINPDDPRAPSAMTGVITGKLAGDTLQADIHVAGPDATVVREAKVELKRK